MSPWTYTITALPAQDAPLTCTLFLENTDGDGNYRGIEVGRYTARDLAIAAAAKDKATRTDWRTATEVDMSRHVSAVA